MNLERTDDETRGQGTPTRGPVERRGLGGERGAAREILRCARSFAALRMTERGDATPCHSEERSPTLSF